MSLKDRILAAFSQIPDEAFTDSDSGDESTAPPATASTAPVSAVEPDPQLTALMSKVAQLEAEKREERANNLTDTLIREGKVLPANREGVKALFSAALEDDEREVRVITFSNGQKLSRTDALRATFDAQPAAVQLGEAESSQVLYSSAYQAKEKSDEEKAKDLERLMAMTDLGKAALAARANGHKEN